MIEKEIARLSTKEYVDDFYAKYGTELDECILMIQKDEKEFKHWRSSFYKSQKRLAVFSQNLN